MHSFGLGRKKTSTVYPGGVRMSIHEAPVFSDRSAIEDNVRMVSLKNILSPCVSYIADTTEGEWN